MIGNTTQKAYTQMHMTRTDFFFRFNYVDTHTPYSIRRREDMVLLVCDAVEALALTLQRTDRCANDAYIEC